MVNLLPQTASGKWRSWSPRENIAPEMKNENGALVLDSRGKFEAFGVWMNEAVPAREGAYYDFNVEFAAENCVSPETSAYAITTWHDSTGKLILREYAAERKKLPNGRTGLGRIFRAPEGAADVVCELCFRWSAGGRVTYFNPTLTETGPPKKRAVRVAAAYTSLPVPRTLEGNERAILETLEMAGSHGVDIVCLSEVINADGVDLPLTERSAELPGPLTDKIGEAAKKYNMYVVAGLSAREGGLCHNVAALVGRDGKYIGRYKKIQLPLAEVENGYTPGSEFPVFETDFGKIGMMICWDQGFPEIARSVATAGAEIIFVPTMWYADVEARARAAENAVYVVTCARPNDEVPARIIDPCGNVIAMERSSRSRQRGICFADIDLNERYYQMWLSVGPCDGERAAFRVERRYDAYGPAILPKAIE